MPSKAGCATNVIAAPKLFEVIKDCKKPVVGLGFMTEWQQDDPGLHPSYTCHLCHVSCTWSVVIQHILGTKHRLAFLKSVDPKEFNYVESLKLKKTSLDELVEQIARRHEIKLGCGAMKVELEKPEVAPHTVSNIEQSEAPSHSASIESGAVKTHSKSNAKLPKIAKSLSHVDSKPSTEFQDVHKISKKSDHSLPLDGPSFHGHFASASLVSSEEKHISLVLDSDLYSSPYLHTGKIPPLTAAAAAAAYTRSGQGLDPSASDLVAASTSASVDRVMKRKGDSNKAPPSPKHEDDHSSARPTYSALLESHHERCPSPEKMYDRHRRSEYSRSGSPSKYIIRSSSISPPSKRHSGSPPKYMRYSRSRSPLSYARRSSRSRSPPKDVRRSPTPQRERLTSSVEGQWRPDRANAESQSSLDISTLLSSTHLSKLEWPQRICLLKELTKDMSLASDEELQQLRDIMKHIVDSAVQYAMKKLPEEFQTDEQPGLSSNFEPSTTAHAAHGTDSSRCRHKSSSSSENGFSF